MYFFKIITQMVITLIKYTLMYINLCQKIGWEDDWNSNYVET